MNKCFLVPLCCAATFAACSLSGCKPKHDHEHDHHHEHAHEHSHTAAHGGCLNALGTCENGHVEAKIEGAALLVWFVGGGSDTEKAVRIPDEKFVLNVTLAGATTARSLELVAQPNALSEEKINACSHFVGHAEWLKGVTILTATGRVTFRGRQQDVRIVIPTGYDPD